MKLLLAIVAAAALAADEKPAPKPAPPIPLELQVEFFRTDGALTRLKAEVDHANAEYEAAVAAMVKACGEGFAPTQTQDKKRLYCAPLAK